MRDISRRGVIGLVGAAAAWPLVARAQQRERMRHIGVLMSLAADDPDAPPCVSAFAQGLQERSWTVGGNVRIDYRWGAGDLDLFRKYATELVALKPDVIVATAASLVAALQQASRTVPIVFVTTIDPVGSGLVASLAKPGGNLTGLTFFLAEVSGKRVELIKEAIPAVTRLAVLFNPANPGMRLPIAAVQRTADALGVELVPIEVKGRDDIAGGFTAAARGRASALMVVEEPLTISSARHIAALALQNRLPMIGFAPQAQAGEAGRFACCAIEQIRTRNQRANSVHAGPHRAGQAARCRRRGDRMRRREFITVLGGAAAWPPAARAQRRERVRRISTARLAQRPV